MMNDLDPELQTIVRKSIKTMCEQEGKRTKIYNELGKHYRSKIEGFEVPYIFDAICSQKIENWNWGTREE